MSEDSEIECDWKTIPGCVGTVYDPNPLAKNWILLHGPDIPAIQHLKNKLTVNTKSSKRNITQTEAVVEPERDPPAEISTDVCKQKASDTNKRQRRVLPTVGSGNPQAVINIFAKPVNKIVESNWLYDTLSIEQKEIHDFVILKKKNVFYSGSAGTGKSVLLKSIISTFKTQLNPEQIAVTASTGVAAVNISGTTLHSFAGIQLGDKPAGIYISGIMRKAHKTRALREVRVLIVDEISMINAELLDKVEYILRKVRSNPAPFGGIQIVFCGDFYQLPPVGKGSNNALAFEALCWKKTIDQTFFLKTPFRQRDQGFVKMLNEIRVGKISPETETVFMKLSRPLQGHHNIVPTELYPLRSQVDIANSVKLSTLSGDEHIFISQDSGPQSDTLLKNCMAPERLVLKVGAQVMLLKNLTPTLVNGSIGVIDGFYKKHENSKELPVVQFANGEKRSLVQEEWKTEIGGKTMACRSQIPLMLAWAISIHKSQGQTIDWMKVDLAKIFETGQAYVALSRGVSLDNMQVLNFNRSRVRAHEGVADFYNGIK